MPAPTRPKRRRRVLATAATACAVVSAAAWAASLRWGVVRVFPTRPKGAASIGIMSGSLCASSESDRPVSSGYWSTGRADPSWAIWIPEVHAEAGVSLFVFLPLWIPTAASGLAAAALWRIDITRRRRIRVGV